MWITLGVVCATALATIRWLSTRLNSMREQVKYYENHWQAIAVELAQEHISAHEAPMKQEIAELIKLAGSDDPNDVDLFDEVMDFYHWLKS